MRKVNQSQKILLAKKFVKRLTNYPGVEEKFLKTESFNKYFKEICRTEHSPPPGTENEIISHTVTPCRELVGR